jgi:hypothetical protein
MSSCQRDETYGNEYWSSDSRPPKHSAIFRNGNGNRWRFNRLPANPPILRGNQPTERWLGLATRKKHITPTRLQHSDLHVPWPWEISTNTHCSSLMPLMCNTLNSSLRAIVLLISEAISTSRSCTNKLTVASFSLSRITSPKLLDPSSVCKSHMDQMESAEALQLSSSTRSMLLPKL